MSKLLFLIILLGFFIDYSFLPALGASFAGTSLVLVAIVIACLERSYFESVLWAVFCGLMLDYVSHVPFGTNAFLLVGLVWVYDFLRRKLLPAKITFSLALLLFLSSFVLYEVFKLIFLNLLEIFGLYNFGNQDQSGSFLVLLMIKVFIALLGLLLFRFYGLVKKVWGIDRLEIKI